MISVLQLQYKYDTVNQLKDLYRMLVQPMTTDADEDGNVQTADKEEIEPWNLNISEFKQVSLSSLSRAIGGTLNPLV